MWTTSRLKQEAKGALSKFGYWLPFLVSAAAALITGLLAGGSALFTDLFSYSGTSIAAILSGDPSQLEGLADKMRAALEQFFSDPLVTVTTLVLAVLITVLSLCFRFAWNAFVVHPLHIGENRFYMEHRGFETRFSRLFYVFGNGRYMNSVKTMFFYELKIFLWSLLFIIPGVIKSYEYCMVPYILAENPQISTDRAFELSKKMTDGEKWHIFCLQLSFIGWYFLAAIACCGLGSYFLMPYVNATHAELYQVLREKAHGLGFATYEELPGFFPEQA